MSVFLLFLVQNSSQEWYGEVVAHLIALSSATPLSLGVFTLAQLPFQAGVAKLVRALRRRTMGLPPSVYAIRTQRSPACSERAPGVVGSERNVRTQGAATTARAIPRGRRAACTRHKKLLLKAPSCRPGLHHVGGVGFGAHIRTGQALRRVWVLGRFKRALRALTCLWPSHSG